MNGVQTRRWSFRTRLLVSMIGITACALIVVGTATIVIVQRGARQAAIDDVRHKATSLQTIAQQFLDDTTTGNRGGSGSKLGVRQFLNQLRATAQVTDARLVFISNGRVLQYAELVNRPRIVRLLGTDISNAELISLPKGFSVADLSPDRIAQGTPITVRRSNRVFLAASIPTSQSVRVLPVVILTEAIDPRPARRATLAFVVCGGVAIGCCFIITVWLSRRLTQPLADIDRAARAIASGDLNARVEMARSTDREFAAIAQTLNHTAAELNSARHAQSSFLQAVSHDLRTPLTSIRGYAEALADGTLDATDEESRNRAALVISNESRRLERLVGDLLDLSRLETQGFSMRPRPCDGAAVVAQLTQGFQPQADSLGVRLQVLGTVSPIPCDLDPERLTQAVANLIENALKYAISRVDVTVGSVDDQLCIHVGDDGPGIPIEAQPHVFERLYTTRTTPGRAVGTGLGLAIVRELANTMGGTCALEGSNREGTIITLCVPRGTSRQAANPTT